MATKKRGGKDKGSSNFSNELDDGLAKKLGFVELGLSY